MEKIKVAVLISGWGSNLEALIKACQDENFPARIALVISNKKDVNGLKIAAQNNIPNLFLDHKKFVSREEFDKKLSAIIAENNCQLICLAGFMRMLSPWFVNQWFDMILNIHPSLLPAFKGANPVADALSYGVKFSGCTVHFIREEMDSGPIIAQAVVEVREDDDEEILAARILEKEHLIYAQALKMVCQKKLGL